MFATQPKLFNPITVVERSNDVIFAGSWYKKFEDRCNVMKQIFDRLLDEGYNIKIYDRMYELHYADYAYPEKYQQFVNPGVQFNQMPNVYKESRLGLNINTVTHSPTMFARRVYELMSSNTLVFSNFSKAVDLLFGDSVIFLDRDVCLDDFDFEKTREKNLYNVLENHTYSNRFRQILDTVGINYYLKENKIILIYSTRDYENVDEIITHFNSIKYPYKQLKIIISHNFDSKLNHVDVKHNIIIEEELQDFVDNLSDDEYVCFINSNVEPNFIKKALLHFKYLPNTFGVCSTDEYLDKYTFNSINNVHNVVFSNDNFKRIFNSNRNNNLINFEVYYI